MGGADSENMGLCPPSGQLGSQDKEGRERGWAMRPSSFSQTHRQRSLSSHPGSPTSYGSGDNLPFIHIELEAKVGHPNGPMDWGAGERGEMCKSEGEAVTRRRWEGIRCHRSQVG